MDTNVLNGGVFLFLPFLNKSLLPFSPTQLTFPQAHHPSNSWTSIQACHRHCFLKITPPICRKHILSISARSKNLSHAAWKCQALWLPSSVHYISNAFSDLPVSATQGPCSCLFTLLKVQEEVQPSSSLFQAAQGSEKEKTTAPTGVTNLVLQDL